jgi:hypothetical protein
MTGKTALVTLDLKQEIQIQIKMTERITCQPLCDVQTALHLDNTRGNEQIRCKQWQNVIELAEIKQRINENCMCSKVEERS